MPLVETTSNNERRVAALRAEVKAHGVGAIQAPKRRPADGKGAAAVAPDPKRHVRRFVGQSSLWRRRLVEQRRASRRPRFVGCSSSSTRGTRGVARRAPHAQSDLDSPARGRSCPHKRNRCPVLQFVFLLHLFVPKGPTDEIVGRLQATGTGTAPGWGHALSKAGPWLYAYIKHAAWPHCFMTGFQQLPTDRAVKVFLVELLEMRPVARAAAAARSTRTAARSRARVAWSRAGVVNSASLASPTNRCAPLRSRPSNPASPKKRTAHRLDFASKASQIPKGPESGSDEIEKKLEGGRRRPSLINLLRRLDVDVGLSHRGGAGAGAAAAT